MRVCGWILVVFLLFSALALDGNLIVFLEPRSLVVVLGGVLSVLLITQTQLSWMCFLRLIRGYKPTKEDRAATLGFLSTGSRYSITFGVIVFFVQLINNVANLSDPAAIGPALVVSLTPLFYGFVLSELLFEPLVIQVEAETQGQIQSKPSRGMLVAISIITLTFIAVIARLLAH